MRRSLLILPLAALMGCGSFTTSNSSNRKGVSLQNEGKTLEAIGAFRNASQQNPSNYRSHYYLAQNFEKLGNDQEALQSYRTAYNVVNTTFDGKHDLKWQKMILDAYTSFTAKAPGRDSEVAAITARARQANDPRDYELLAKIHVAAGDADAAIDAFNQGTMLAPRDYPLAREYGLYLASLGQKSRAEPVLIKAYQLKQDDAVVNATLRQMGIVPGPSLLERGQLAKPLLPKGPLPEVELNPRVYRGE